MIRRVSHTETGFGNVLHRANMARWKVQKVMMIVTVIIAIAALIALLALTIAVVCDRNAMRVELREYIATRMTTFAQLNESVVVEGDRDACLCSDLCETSRWTAVCACNGGESRVGISRVARRLPSG